MQEVGMSIMDSLAEDTSYGRTAAQEAGFDLNQANMFVNAEREGNGDMRRPIEGRLASARRNAEELMRRIEAAERTLSGPLNESRIEYLHRTTIDMSAIRAIPRQPDCTAPLAVQMRALEAVCIRFGLNDAVDVLRRQRGGAEVETNWREVVNLDVLGGIRQYEQVQTATNDQLHAMEIVAEAFGLRRAANEIRRMTPAR